VLLFRRVCTVPDGRSPWLLRLRFLLRHAFVAREGGDRQEGKGKAPLSSSAGAAAAPLKAREKSLPTRPAVEARW
jgi:hypothetical protein